MFLPVLLVRDFGIWGIVVFAVPNVLGAAGMGWVLARPGLSERLVRDHRTACRWFSAITLTFQLFFLWWLLFMTPQEPRGKEVWVAVPVCVLGLLLSCLSMDPDGSIHVHNAAASRRQLNFRWAPPLLWLTSLFFAAALFARGDLWYDPHRLAPPQLGSTAVLVLAPVCCFGFALCPYMDLTFHHARQRAFGTPGTLAFTFGFGVLFAAMILFTLGYAHLFLSRSSLRDSFAAARPAAFLVFCHIAVQAAFTIKVHLIALVGPRRTRAVGPQFRVVSAARLFVIVLGMMGLPILVPALSVEFPSYHGLATNEVVYRLFMACYGLVFPAYVWLCMIPTRDGLSGPTRHRLTIWAAAVLVAAPMFWMGFIERQTWWLGPGLAVVLAARLFLPRGEKTR